MKKFSLDPHVSGREDTNEGWTDRIAGDENTRNTRQNRIETRIFYSTYPRARVSLGGKRFDLPTTSQRGSPYSASSRRTDLCTSSRCPRDSIREIVSSLEPLCFPLLSSREGKRSKRIFEACQLENRGGIEKLKMKFDAVMEEGSDIIAAAAFSQAFHPVQPRFSFRLDGKRRKREREKE